MSLHDTRINRECIAILFFKCTTEATLSQISMTEVVIENEQ